MPLKGVESCVEAPGEVVEQEYGTVIREHGAEQARGLDPQAPAEQALLEERKGVYKGIPNVDSFMSARGLHLLHLNVRSLTEIRHLSKSRKVGIFCFTETWLDDSITDAEIELENYLVIRRDQGMEKVEGCVYM